MNIKDLATNKYRWFALVFLALGLAIVIIDNTVLNVAIPYILRDLNTSFDAMQWVISGYALLIATILITVGRLGDMFGRKKIFIIGTIFFAIGSFIASVSPNIFWLFVGEAVIEAIGAACMLTSSLSLLVTEFHGKERAIAFGVWGSVAGASASLGPLLGGFLTTYYSWRWSLRINVIVAIVAILGTVFVEESKADKKNDFDWLGTVFSGLGLFSLVFGFIEGRNYGWWTPNAPFVIGNWTWPLTNISIIPYVFGLAAWLLTIFILIEQVKEKAGKSPLVRLSLFKNVGFSLGLVTLSIIVMGQFGTFIILPIYFQNVLGFSAFTTGVVFLWSSLITFIVGPLSGIAASRIGPKWVVSTGMFVTALATYLIIHTLRTNATGLDFAPSLILFGTGFGMVSAQLTNIILSSVPVQYAGEASAVNATFRQVGTSIGLAVIGTVLAATLSTNIVSNVKNDSTFPAPIRSKIADSAKHINAESGQQAQTIPIASKGICYVDDTLQPIMQERQANNQSPLICIAPEKIKTAIKADVDTALVGAAKNALNLAITFTLIGAFLSLFIPNNKPRSWNQPQKEKNS